jgi:phage terminase large subunit
MSEYDSYVLQGHEAGCPPDQMENFCAAGIILQPRQLAASAAARLCDRFDGPTAVGYGGARGGGKSHWLLAQMGADDCQRVPGLKCLLLRKIGRSNLENFQDFRKRLFTQLPHKFAASEGVLEFPNGSRIISGHFKCENDIDKYLGLEYDIIGIEEATTLTSRKYQAIGTVLRTSKPNWRPRIYSTTNPGGVGHEWYRSAYVIPHELGTETTTRFIPARVNDNKFTNPGYEDILAALPGWQYDAWYKGDWNISAGQFFSNFRPEVHILDDFNDARGIKWVCAMDYGYTHYNVVLLGCYDFEDNLYIVDEHAARGWVPQRHVIAIKEMLQRHKIYPSRMRPELIREEYPDMPIVWPNNEVPTRFLNRFVAGGDMFSRQADGRTIASHYKGLETTIHPANSNRVLGWAEILRRLGDPDAGIPPTLFFHKRCKRLLECLPYLQHDPAHPADVLKTNTNEEGIGGDDPADALRYLVTGKIPVLHQMSIGM